MSKRIFIGIIIAFLLLIVIKDHQLIKEQRKEILRLEIQILKLELDKLKEKLNSLYESPNKIEI